MSWLSWPVRWAGFIAWYIWALITSNVSVIKDNLTPGQDSTPGIARYETRCITDGEVTLLSALITLTPGTLTMGTRVEEDSGVRVIYVHALYFENPDQVREDTADMEHHMLKAMRRRGDAQ